MWDTVKYLLIIYVVVINIVTYCVYAADKSYAKKDKWRVPEKTLILLAVIGGSVGALLAMKVLRHKTKHVKFYLGVPVILALQVIAVLAAIILPRI